MAQHIIAGTTPTVTYTFEMINPSNIRTAILTVRRDGEIIVRKTLEQATVAAKTISWVLTQADTLAIGTSTAKMMLNWVTQDGVRGASNELSIKGDDNHIDEVI